MEKLQVIKNNADSLFIKKEDIDFGANNVVAGIINAASYMAIASEIVDRDATMDVLIDAYGVRENKEVNDLIGIMEPSAVKAATGFATDFMDYGAAKLAYDSQKEKFDKLYNGVKAYSELKQVDKQM